MSKSEISGVSATKPSLVKNWHRRIGVLSAVFVMILAVSGIFLNHTSSLNLDKRMLRSAQILNWYGVELPEILFGISVGKRWVTNLGGRIFLDQKMVGECMGDLLAAGEFDGQVLVACQYEVLVLTTGGELIEQLDGGEDFEDIKTQLAASANKIEVIPEGLHVKLVPFAVGDGMTLERLILDIHSGRILGTWGIYLMDVMAGLFVILALSGLIIWWRGTRQTDI